MVIFWRVAGFLALATAVGWGSLVTEAAAQGSATADRAALAAVYDATGGPNWENSTNWKTSAPLNQWWGVQTDATGRVTVLNLGENGLSGPLPAALGDLTHAYRLSLWGNDLTGAIPSALRNLRRLERLNLAENALTGSIPAWLGELPNLQDILLAENAFTGTIPAALGNLRRLGILHLYANNLEGAIPPWLGDRSNLWFLDLAGNELTGTIPASLRNLHRLNSLNLGGNDLTGVVPTWLGDLSRLTWLGLWRNGLTGTIPASLRNLDELEFLNLGGNDLTGVVPTWLGDLSRLTWIGLWQNDLTGTVPSALGRLQDLETLYLHYNPLTGILPQDLMRLSRLTDLSIRATAVCAPTDDPFLAWLATIDFRGETCNRAPATVDSIPAETLTAPESRGVSVAAYFTDPDDDALTYMAESAQADQVTAVVSGDTVWLSAGEAGEASVSVAACDPDRLCADQILRVTVQSETTASLSDREALEAFYDATGGDAWADRTNWKTSAALDSWYGVRTGPSGRVTGLDLRGNGLTGAIPVALRSLAELEDLQLGDNSLAGPVPPWFGGMSSLRWLSLAWNELTGPIPAELGDLRDLRQLDLAGNELTGAIPHALRNLGNLEWLSLSWNNLTGPIPSWVTNFTNLRGLWLYRNELTGPIPTGLGALSELRYLTLGANDLTPGPIPAELGDLDRLERLWLGAANRTGPIPTELGSLTNLWDLSLWGNALTGGIPDELGGLTGLTYLNLDYNFGLSGPIPADWDLPDLDHLDIFLTRTCAPEGWQDRLATIDFRGTVCGTEEENRTIDVAVFYTPSAREAAGGTEAVEAGIDLMIAVTNQAFRDSDVRTRVALVARSEVEYSETGVSLTDLRRFVDPSDGHMDDIHGMREEVGADLVHLIVDEANVGGIARRPGAFGLSRWPGGSFPHELGHNLGLRHDRYEVVGKYRLRSDPAYGYVNPGALEPVASRSSQWRTIMAYLLQCRDRFTYCTRVPRFSNPRQRYNGDRLGVPLDDEAALPGLIGPADAAAVIDVTGPVLAAWRDRPPDAAQVVTAALPAGRQQRVVGGVRTPRGSPGGIFADALLAAQTPGPGAVVAPGSPGPSEFPSLRQRLVAVDFGQLGAAAAVVSLNLFDDAVFTGLVEETEPTLSGGYVLSGRLDGVEFGTVTLVVNGGAVAGLVWTPDATYRVSPAGGGLHTVSQVDRERLLPLGDPIPLPRREDDLRNRPGRR